MQPLVEHLKKISIRLHISHRAKPWGQSVMLEFIYGIAPQGLTPLEQQLEGKSSGATIHMDCRTAELISLLGHLAPGDLRLPLDNIGMLQLAVTIQAVTTPSDREIVKAIAKLAQCGDCCGH